MAKWGIGGTGIVIPGDIVACLDELGITYSLRGDEATGLCPHPDHHDSHPSWSCNIETGQHNCFSCGFSGSFVSLVTDVLGIDKIQATRWCRARGGVEKARELINRPAKVNTLTRYNEAALAMFTDPPPMACAKRLLSLEACQELGVLWDAERDMWITPIRDPYTGKLWGYQEKNERVFRNRPADIRKSKTLFGLQNAEGDTAILVESPLDVVRLRTVGYRGGISSCGVRVSREQLDIINTRFGKLILALDNDSAGVSESARIRRSFRRIPVTLFDYQNTKAKDIGEMGADEIKRGIRSAYSYRSSRS